MRFFSVRRVMMHAKTLAIWLVVCTGAMHLYGCKNVVSATNNTSVPLYVGTQNRKGAEGVFSLNVDSLTGQFSKPELIIQADSPSFLGQTNSEVLYAAVRDGGGHLASFKKDSNGEFDLISKQPTQGRSPCYVAFNPSQTFVATANYGGGSTSIFRINQAGEISASPTIVQHSGSSITERQKAPHAHWVQWSKWDSNVLYVVDLGIDEVKKYSFSPETGKVTRVETAVKTQPGAGPRQMVFHPTKRLVYILNELDNTLVTAAVDADGLFRIVDTIPTLPSDFKEHSQASHIVISSDGKTIYTSNRGHNSIARFSLTDSGQASIEQHISTNGDWPRYFTLLEEQSLMLVANQRTHTLFSYRVESDGALVSTGHSAKINFPSYVEKAQF